LYPIIGRNWRIGHPESQKLIPLLNTTLLLHFWVFFFLNFLIPQGINIASFVEIKEQLILKWTEFDSSVAQQSIRTAVGIFRDEIRIHVQKTCERLINA